MHMTLQDAVPQISVMLYKSVVRSAVSGSDPVSGRYSSTTEIDLTPYLGDGSAVRTSKSVREPAGAFSITFSDRPNVSTPSVLETVYGLVEPMDMVEIRMWNGLGPKPDPLPIKMRGFITEVQRQQTMGPNGKPVRQVVVSGQDYGKIWQTYQVIYLHAYLEGKPLLSNYSLSELFGLPVENAMPAADFVRVMINQIINPHLAALVPSPMPKTITVGDGVTVSRGAANLSYQEMQGSIYSLLTNHTDVGTWNELYTEDREDGVHLVYRPIPAFMLPGVSEGGSKIMPDAPTPPLVHIPASDVVSKTVTRTDNVVSNFFWVQAPRFDLIADMQRKLAAITDSDPTVSLRDYPNAAVKYYGIRPMHAETQLGDTSILNQTGGFTEGPNKNREQVQFDWITTRRLEMLQMNQDNIVYERGTARIKGGPERPDETAMKAGDYAVFEFGGIKSEAYVTQIDDEFAPYQGYTTTLHFERGTGFAKRIQLDEGPWLVEQISR